MDSSQRSWRHLPSLVGKELTTWFLLSLAVSYRVYGVNSVDTWGCKLEGLGTRLVRGWVSTKALSSESQCSSYSQRVEHPKFEGSIISITLETTQCIYLPPGAYELPILWQWWNVQLHTMESHLNVASYPGLPLSAKSAKPGYKDNLNTHKTPPKHNISIVKNVRGWVEMGTYSGRLPHSPANHLPPLRYLPPPTSDLATTITTYLRSLLSSPATAHPWRQMKWGS